ncbi:MAG: ABC transporter permease, partial [Acidobacteriota bacterium]
PVPDAHELAGLDAGEDFWASGMYAGRTTSLTYGQFESLAASQQVFKSLVAFSTTRFNISPGGEGRFASGLYVTNNFFRDLGVELFMGSGFAPQSDVRDCSGAGVVASYAFWLRELGGDPQVIGREMLVESIKLPVVGVAPPGFYGLETAQRFDIAAPLCVDTLLASERGGRLDNQEAWWLATVGRLKPGFSV